MKKSLTLLLGTVLILSLFLFMNISAAENVSESEDSLLTSAPENGKGMSFKEIEDKAGTVPGEAFYFLDRAFDTFKSSEKLADERAYELAVLANKSAEGEIDNKTMEKARERYEKVMEKVRRRTRSREDTSERVANSTTNHLEALSMVYEKVPEQAKGAIENAMNRSMKGRENALNALGSFNESKAEKMRNQTSQRIQNRVSENVQNMVMERTGMDIGSRMGQPENIGPGGPEAGTGDGSGQEGQETPEQGNQEVPNETENNPVA